MEGCFRQANQKHFLNFLFPFRKMIPIFVPPKEQLDSFSRRNYRATVSAVPLSSHRIGGHHRHLFRHLHTKEGSEGSGKEEIVNNHWKSFCRKSRIIAQGTGRGSGQAECPLQEIQPLPMRNPNCSTSPVPRLVGK